MYPVVVYQLYINITMVAPLPLLASFALLAMNPSSTTPDSLTVGNANGASERYASLIEWMRNSHPSSIINPSVSIKASPLGGYGAFVDEGEGLKEGDVIFSIPREACITPDIVLGDPQMGEILKKVIEKAGSGAYSVAMAAYIARQRLLSQVGKEEGGSDDSVEVAFGPYLDTLPWKRGDNGQDHVLFWRDDVVEDLMPGSLCYLETLGLRDEVKLARKMINPLIGSDIYKARGEWVDDKPIIPFLKWTTPPPPKITEPVPGLGRAVNAAFVNLLTRGFDAYPAGERGVNDDFEFEDDAGGERLIPVFDVLNHDNSPNVRHLTLPDGGPVLVTARWDIKGGEELLNQYRPEEEESMPYHRFFTRFGFVPGMMGEDTRAMLRDRSPVFFAQRREI